MPDKMDSLKRISVIRGLLDSLVEAKGREKAGYISVIDDFLNYVQEDILIKEETINDLQKKVNEVETKSQE